MGILGEGRIVAARSASGIGCRQIRLHQRRRHRKRWFRSEEGCRTLRPRYQFSLYLVRSKLLEVRVVGCLTFRAFRKVGFHDPVPRRILDSGSKGLASPLLDAVSKATYLKARYACNIHERPYANR